MDPYQVIQTEDTETVKRQIVHKDQGCTNDMTTRTRTPEMCEAFKKGGKPKRKKENEFLKKPEQEQKLKLQNNKRK